jgi:hypothetical protein
MHTLLLQASIFFFFALLINSNKAKAYDLSTIQPPFCDSILIDSVWISGEEPFRNDMIIQFRNLNARYWAYPTLTCQFDDETWYKPKPDYNIVSVFDGKGGTFNGITQFPVKLQRSTSPQEIPSDYLLRANIMMRFPTDNGIDYDTCIFLFNFRPGKSNSTSSIDNQISTQAGQIMISPLPADDYTYITAQDFQNAALYTPTGNKIREYHSQLIDDLQSLPSGIYYVHIRQNRTLMRIIPLVISH